MRVTVSTFGGASGTLTSRDQAISPLKSTANRPALAWKT